uniref:Uncharacterized protein n=1 Tax=Lepeophtheirus salmonis TaxID=72036 RepID=A0A0K2TGU4_LEPSM
MKGLAKCIFIFISNPKICITDVFLFISSNYLVVFVIHVRNCQNKGLLLTYTVVVYTM